MPLVVANRYAQALADVVATTQGYRKTLRELEDFLALYRESADLREVCESPAVPPAEKLKVLEAILLRLESSTTTLNFIRVLASHYRLPLLEEIVPAFRKIVYDRMEVAQVKISSATGLSEAQRELLRRRFGELTRKQVELDFQLDPTLLGGIVAQIGSTVYDGSIKGALERLHEQLLAGQGVVPE